MHRFRTIDREFTAREKEEIKSWSSRFSPTANAVDYIYHYGSFKKDRYEVFPKYFDALLYVNGWGTRQVMFRFPRELVKWEELNWYKNRGQQTSLDFKQIEDYVLMELTWHQQNNGDWMEEEDYLLDPLLPLREEILHGDFRSLYLAWLIVEAKNKGGKNEGSTPSTTQLPPIPSNLKEQTKAHQYLIQLFDLDPMLVEAAATASPEKLLRTPEYADLIPLLSDKEKEKYLFQFLNRETRTEIKLKKRLTALSGVKSHHIFGESLPWNEIYTLAKQKKEEAIEAQKRAERRAYYRKMRSIGAQQDNVWEGVERNLSVRNSGGYDRATNMLKDLRDLAVFEDKMEAFDKKLEEVIAPYRKSGALLRRLRENDIIRVVKA